MAIFNAVAVLKTRSEHSFVIQGILRHAFRPNVPSNVKLQKKQKEDGSWFMLVKAQSNTKDQVINSPYNCTFPLPAICFRIDHRVHVNLYPDSSFLKNLEKVFTFFFPTKHIAIEFLQTLRTNPDTNTLKAYTILDCPIYQMVMIRPFEDTEDIEIKEEKGELRIITKYKHMEKV